MAALNRPTEATYAVHENVTVDTTDHEDHTFCGIMFPVKCKELLPLNHVVIHSVAVRGQLGPLTVWVSKEQPNQGDNTNKSFRLCPRYWTKIYDQTLPPSFRQYRELDFRDNPVIIKPGQVRAIYIHSTLPGDEAIVYDNRHSRRTYDDALLSILPGRAHVSETPFGASPIWGWGNAWRDHREFVGRIEFGAVYKLWNPVLAPNFGSKFQSLVRTLFLCQRRWESPMSMLPDDCIFYILNMCRWDWVNDSQTEMKELRRRKRLRSREAELAAAAAAAEQRAAETQRATETEAATAAGATAGVAQCVASGETRSSCCKVPCHQHEEEEDDEEDISDEEANGDYHPSDEGGNHEEDAGDAEDEDYVPDEIDYEEIEDDDSEDREDDESDWDEDSAYLVDNNIFMYRDDDSDEEEGDNGEAVQERNRRAWIRQQFARIHVLRALATLDDNADALVEMDF